MGPDDEFGFLVEVLEEREEAWGGLVAGGGESGGVGEHACAVFDCEETVLCGAAEFREAGRGVGGAVEAGMIGVEFVEGGFIGGGIERNREVGFSGGKCECFVNAGFSAQAEENRVEGLVLFGFDVSRAEEAVLLYVDGVFVLGDGDDGVADVFGPDVHDFLDVLAAGVTESRP